MHKEVLAAAIATFALGLCAAEPARLDHFGDPLPAGAIFRLGTTRYRPPSGHFEFAPSRDAKAFATGEEGRVTLWDASTGKPRWRRDLPKGVTCDELSFAPDGGRLMVVGRGRGREPFASEHPLFLLDAASGDEVATLQPPNSPTNVWEWRFLRGGDYFLTMEKPVNQEPQIFFGNGSPPRDAVPVVWDLKRGKEVARFPISTDITASGDGRVLAVTFKDCVRLWDAAAGKTLHDLICKDATFDRLELSADGSTLAACRTTPPEGECRSRREHLVCWDVGTGKVLLAAPFDRQSFALSRDGARLAIMDQYSRLTIRTVRTGEPIVGEWLIDNVLLSALPFIGRGHDDLAFGVGGTLVVRNRFLGLRVFDTDTGLCRRRLTADRGHFQTRDLSDDGKTVITSSKGWFMSGPAISIQDADTGSERAGLRQHRGPIRELLLSPDRRLLASRDAGGEVHVWDLPAGRQLLSPLEGTAASVPQGKFAFQGNDTVVALDRDATAHVWQARTGKLVRRVEMADFATLRDWARAEHHYEKEEKWLSLSADGEAAAVAGFHQVLAWDLRDGRQLARAGVTKEYVNQIQLVNGGKSLVIDAGKTSLIRDVASARGLAFQGEELEGGFRVSKPHTAVSPDGKWLARRGLDSLTLYQVDPPRKVWSVPGNPGGGPKRSQLDQWCDFTADGRHVAGVTAGGTIVLLDLQTGEEVRRVEPPDEGDDLWCHMHPPREDGVIFLGAGPDTDRCRFRLFDAQRGRLPPTLRSAERYVNSHDGRLIAYTLKGEVTVIEARTGEAVGGFRAVPGGAVECLLFGDGDRTLITGGSDTAVVVWDWAAAARLKPEPDAVPDAGTWEALGSGKASAAFRALLTITAHPSEGTRLLQEQLKPAATGDAERIRRWIAELDGDRFAVRDAARRKLVGAGRDALPELRAALRRPHTADAAKTLEELVGQAERDRPTGEAARRLRAVQALEWMDTPESRRLLRELAAGEPGFERTAEAAAALGRVGGH